MDCKTHLSKLPFVADGGCRPSLALNYVERFEGHFFDFDFAAFALDANVAGGEIAAGNLVHQLAVDDEVDAATPTNNLIRPPLARRIFILRSKLGNASGFGGECMTIGGDPGVQMEIALVLIFALALDALGPYRIRGLNMDKDARIISVRRDFHETPNDGEFVIMIGILRPGIAVGLAGAMNHAIAHTPGLHGIGIGLHAEGPAVEVLPVKQFGGQRRRDRLRRGRRFASGSNNKDDNKNSEEKKACGGFHARSIALPPPQVKRPGLTTGGQFKNSGSMARAGKLKDD